MFSQEFGFLEGVLPVLLLATGVRAVSASCFAKRQGNAGKKNEFAEQRVPMAIVFAAFFFNSHGLFCFFYYYVYFLFLLLSPCSFLLSFLS